MHTIEQVFDIIGQEVPPGPIGVQPIAVERAHGQILARPILAQVDSPPFDRALLDGFAVRSAEAVAGAQLHIIGRQDAGKAVFRQAMGPGECVAINTGGVLPPEADAVLMIEHTAPAGDPGHPGLFVRATQGVPPGYGIQRQGADVKKGDRILFEGMRLTPAAIAAAIASGAAEMQIATPLKIALLTTGDELVAPGSPITGGQIRNSNHPMLAALVQETLGAAGELLDLGTCPDQEADLRQRLERGLTRANVTIVTGGMSMGTRDLVPPVLRSLGVEFHVEKVRMKPGKPFVFGTRGAGADRRYVTGLPGNPVSAFVTFHLFVREILTRLTGEKTPSRRQRATAEAPFPANGEREFFQPCTLDNRNGQLLAVPLDWRGSGDVFRLVHAHALVRRPAGAPALEVGEPVEILRL